MASAASLSQGVLPLQPHATRALMMTAVNRRSSVTPYRAARTPNGSRATAQGTSYRCHRWLCSLFVIWVGATSCASVSQHERITVLWKRPGNGTVGTLGLPLRTGQLVLSEAPGPYRLLFGLGTRRFHRFTHSALLVLENGEPYVYDYAGDFKPTFASTPADAIRGGLRRTSLWRYITAHLYVEIVEPPLQPGRKLDRKRLLANLSEIKRRKVPFDAHWDFNDRSAYFCTEFLAVVYAGTGMQLPPLEPLTANPSLLHVLRWFGMRDDMSLPAGTFANPQRRVAAFSQWGSLAAVDAYFAAKAELHRRFTPNYRVGTIFELDGKDVKVRQPIEDFLATARQLATRTSQPLTTPALEAAIQALATQRFGPDGFSTAPLRLAKPQPRDTARSTHDRS